MRDRVGPVVAVLLLAVVAVIAQSSSAGHNLNIPKQMKAADVLLPPGDYKVFHVEQSGQHELVFKKAGKGQAEFRVKCSLEPLPQKATRTQQQYRIENGDNVLISLTFEGDSVKHVLR